MNAPHLWSNGSIQRFSSFFIPSNFQQNQQPKTIVWPRFTGANACFTICFSHTHLCYVCEWLELGKHGIQNGWHTAYYDRTRTVSWRENGEQNVTTTKVLDLFLLYIIKYTQHKNQTYQITSQPNQPRNQTYTKWIWATNRNVQNNEMKLMSLHTNKQDKLHKFLFFFPLSKN